MESIVKVAEKNTATVKRKMSDTHCDRSETTDEETVGNLHFPSTKPHPTATTKALSFSDSFTLRAD